MTGITYFDESRNGKKLKTIKADYRLKCDDCGQEIVLIELGEKEFIIYSPLRSFSIENVNVTEVKKWIEEKNYLKIHELIREKWIQKMGLDYYCPECNKLYCDKEVAIEINYDDGFYDDTMMICHNGHKRCMDD